MQLFIYKTWQFFWGLLNKITLSLSQNKKNFSVVVNEAMRMDNYGRCSLEILTHCFSQMESNYKWNECRLWWLDGDHWAPFEFAVTQNS